ncbi:MAG: LysE family translocator [Rhodospirillales bacterium]
MPDPVLLAGFVAASLIVLIVPGPGVLYVVTRSAAHGFRAGLSSTLGLSAGAFVHVIFAALGLSALLVASATAFGVVKIAGAAYLAYLGIRTIFFEREAPLERVPGALPHRRLFADGVVISIFNPKLAVFFLAYLPQFVVPAAGNVTAQILMLGVIYCALSIVSDGAYALLAGRIRDRLTGSERARRWTRRLSGSVYVGLGVNTALSGRT